jgi:hypothetical protein
MIGGARNVKNIEAPGLRAHAQFIQQGALSRTGFAGNENDSSLSRLGLVETPLQERYFRTASDKHRIQQAFR